MHLDHVPDVEALHRAASLLPGRACALRVLEQGADRPRGRVDVADLDERSPAATHEVRDAADARADDRGREAQRLEHAERQALASGQQHRDVGGPDECRDVAAEAEPMHPGTQPQLGDQSFRALERGPLPAGECEVGAHVAELGECAHRVLVALVERELGDDEHKLVLVARARARCERLRCRRPRRDRAGSARCRCRCRASARGDPAAPVRAGARPGRPRR